MKRIKNIEQLNQERQRIQLRRIELEKAMQRNWTGLKESVSPGRIVQQAVNKLMGKTEDGQQHFSFEGFVKNPVVKQGLNIAFSLLVERVFKKLLKRKPKNTSE